MEAGDIVSNAFLLLRGFRVRGDDYKLNCGAKSCPPIAFYSADKIEQQLEIATLSFLENETDIFSEKKEIHVTTLFKWFLGDFGGLKGIRKILKEKLNIDAHHYKLVFKAYSWEEQLDNYVLNIKSPVKQ